MQPPSTHCMLPLHVWHMLPLWPHWNRWLPPAQIAKPPMLPQQPWHEAASHTHAPFMHLVPMPQAKPVMPQLQRPPAHVSAVLGSQAWQAWPLGPHCDVVRIVWHTPAAQQPIGQFCALQLLQVPLVHVPVPQSWQA
jgi:hypothetical protein